MQSPSISSGKWINENFRAADSLSGDSGHQLWLVPLPRFDVQKRRSLFSQFKLMIPHVTSSHQSLLSIYSFLPCALKKEVFICLFVFIEETVLVSNSACIHWCDRCTLYSRVPIQEHFAPGSSPRPGCQPASGEASYMDQHRSGLQKLTGPTWKGHFLCTWWGC